MARGDNLAAGIQRRITASIHRLVLHFSPVIPAAVGVQPTARPVSPLTAPAPVEQVAAIPTTPRRPDETLVCLWIDTPETTYPAGDLTHRRDFGWVAEADAHARIVIADATRIDNVMYVEHGVVDPATGLLKLSGRYRIIETDLMGGSTGQPHSVAIWLKGAVKQ